MIPKKNRFHGLRSLDFTYRKGKTVRADSISLRFTPAKKGKYRLSVVVSKKVQKSAVTRNRIRRRIYEAARKLDKENKLPNNDMIISVYDEKLATLPAQELQQQVKNLLQKSQKANNKQSASPRS